MGYRQQSHKGKNYLAHRLAYLLCIGDIPEGMVVRHQCDNPPCCNPSHLLLGTRKQNMEDMVSRGRNKTKNKKIGVSNRCSKKLNWWQMETIRGMVSAGAKQKLVAVMFSVSPQTINDLVKGRIGSKPPVWVKLDDYGYNF